MPRLARIDEAPTLITLHLPSHDRFKNCCVRKIGNLRTQRKVKILQQKKNLAEPKIKLDKLNQIFYTENDE